MEDKEQILTMLRAEFNRWEELLAGLSEQEITARQLPGDWSVKDIMAHLMTWQKRSIARLDAARLNHQPEFPGWPEELDPESEEDLNQVNAWIYETNRDRPWGSVYRDWQEGYLRFIEAGEAIPEKDMLEEGKYTWLEGYPLSIVLLSSYGHHHDEHYGPLVSWLGKQGIGG